MGVHDREILWVDMTGKYCGKGNILQVDMTGVIMWVDMAQAIMGGY